MNAATIAELTRLNPLPRTLWGANCACCDKPQARWGIVVVGKREAVFVCARCVLYESEWGRTNDPVVPATIAAVERNSSRRFRLHDGRLSPSDADDVLGVIILTERAASRIPRSPR